MDSQDLLLLIGLILIMMTTQQNIHILGAQGLLMVIGLKLLIKRTRIKINRTMLYDLFIFDKILIPSIPGDPEHSVFYSVVIMIKYIL